MADLIRMGRKPEARGTQRVNEHTEDDDEDDEDEDDVGCWLLVC